MKIKLGVILALLVSTLLFACTSGGKGESSEVPGACSQISAREVSLTLAEDFGEPEEQSKENDEGQRVMSTCRFSARGDGSFTSFSLMLVARPEIDDVNEALERHLVSMAEATGQKDLKMERLNVVEDGAAVYDAQMGQVTVFKENRMMILSLMAPNKEEQKRELLISLVRDALHN